MRRSTVTSILFFVAVLSHVAASPLTIAEAPPPGGAFVYYLGHCGYAVRTRDHLLVFDYQQQQDGQQLRVRSTNPSLSTGWIVPDEIKDLKVRVFVSHSHTDHFDPVILDWSRTVRDIAYFFGWKAGNDLSHAYLVGPRAELAAGDMEIATINSRHAGVPEVAWLVRVDGLVIYHNGDCLPKNIVAEHEFLGTKAERIDLAFVHPMYAGKSDYAGQNRDLFRRFAPRAVFPMHESADSQTYHVFERAFEAEIPGFSVHVPTELGQCFVYAEGRITE